MDPGLRESMDAMVQVANMDVQTTEDSIDADMKKRGQASVININDKVRLPKKKAFKLRSASIQPSSKGRRATQNSDIKFVTDASNVNSRANLRETINSMRAQSPALIFSRAKNQTSQRHSPASSLKVTDMGPPPMK